MRIECSCLLRPSAESCLSVVLLTRDGLGRGGDSSSRENPQPDRGFSQERSLSKGRLVRSGAMITVERGLRRSAVYDPLTSGNGSDGGIGVKRVFRDVI
jgi:hypothetical protein